MKFIVIITHYPENDPEFDGDYASIEILDDKGKRLAEYGDSYHDKGWEKAEGFLHGLMICHPKVKVIKREIADAEAWD